MTHLSVPPEERAVLGITDTMVILLVNTLIVNKPAVVNKLFLLINLLQGCRNRPLGQAMA